MVNRNKPETLRAYEARKRAEWTEQGVCTKCGKREPENGLRLCRPCLDRCAEAKRRRGSAALTAYARARKRRRRLEAIAKYGGYCVCCGEDTPEFLAFDHINNDGARHRKVCRDRDIVEWLFQNNFPDTIQILCHNCNLAKGFYGKCPHSVSLISHFVRGTSDMARQGA